MKKAEIHIYKLTTLLLLFFCPGLLSAQQTASVFKYNKNHKMNYLLYLPQDYDKKNEEAYPLILFLHGGGEAGDDVEMVKRHGPPKLISEGKEFPFIILSPQNAYKDKLWDDFAIKSLLDKIVHKYNVDTSRIYLTGLSRGGYGVWRMAIQYPTTFAAIAPVCGAAPSAYAGWIRELPIWVFHGAKDKVIPVSESEDMVIALKKLGADVKFTIYPNAGHDSWTQSYENPALYEWFLSHKRK